MSVYELLNAAWKRERGENNLVPLESTFYEKCRAYVKHLETQSNSETDEILAQIFNKRWKRVNYLLNDLINLRLEKHFQDILLGVNPPSEIPFEEEDYRRNTETLTYSFRNTILGISQSIEPDTQLEMEEGRYKIAHFIQNENIQSVGSDLKTYGPFSKGDIAIIPPENFRNLLMRSMIDDIKIEK